MTPSTISSFFQIIINYTLQEGKLKFPNKFVHEHGNELYDAVKLSIPTGCCWDVGVKREADGTIWLCDGFLEFMEGNSILIEYFLIFKYEGNSKFIVHIFDLTATEILYNPSSGLDGCNVVNEPQIDETREGRDDSFEYENGDKESDDRRDDSSENESVYELPDDNIGDAFRHESGEEDDGGGGDKDSDDFADASLNDKSVYQVSDDDKDGSFSSESNDEGFAAAGDGGDDTFITESGDKDPNNRGVDSPKYQNSDKDSDDSSIECLGSTVEPSKDKQNVGVSRETTRAGRCYLTRRKRQIIEGSLDANGSTRKSGASGAGSSSSPGNIAKETTPRVQKMRSMVPNSFRVPITPYHITHGMLRVPCKFARSYMSCSTTLIKLIDADNKEWEVLFVPQKNGRDCDYMITEGWRGFMEDKGLMVGDVCVFERVESNEEVNLKVDVICTLR